MSIGTDTKMLYYRSSVSGRSANHPVAQQSSECHLLGMFLLFCLIPWKIFQRSDAGEARTRGPSASSQALYHWATALPVFIVNVPYYYGFVIWST